MAGAAEQQRSGGVMPERSVSETDGPGSRGTGRSASLVELVVKGTLLAGSSAGDPVQFTTYDADGTGNDEWGGLLFDLEGSYDTAYGFIAAVQPVSHLENVSIDSANLGVRIRNTVAPGLVDVSFKNSTLSDVLLDSTDVALVEVSLEGTGDPDFTGVIDSDSTDLYTDEAVWDLTGPVSITATETNGASAAVADAAFGTDDYIDLIVQGKLITHPGESDEMVTFTSQSPDDANGDNWAGSS